MTSTSTFDVDAWLDEAAPPTRSVTVYGRGDLVARLQDLAAQDHDPADRRLAGSPVSAEIADLQVQLDASALILHVRGLLDHEQRTMLDQVTVEGDGQRTVDEQRYELLLLSTAAVEPALTLAQAERMRDRIGQAQWDAVFAAINAASRETIDVPLSRLASETGQAS